MTQAALIQPEPSPLATAQELLGRVFGHQHFRGRQGEIVAHLLAGGDALVLMPTGGGKSLCYQLPALVRRGTGIVVSPLIALMQNQVDALAQLGLKAAYLNSSLAPDAARMVEQRLVQGDLDLLYVAPERLLTPRFLSLLEQTSLSLFAIDEAHCVSQWGHDFRKEYTQLRVLHQRFAGVPRIALTATADAVTREEIIQQLQLEQAQHFIAGFDRPNIHYTVVEKNSANKQLLGFLNGQRQKAGIVYCGTRKKVEETAEWLLEQGFPALPYHAGMNQEARRKNQERFLREDGIIMVATIAFGMGIDKPDVRFVAHVDLPQSLENYYQETGRAGRDGEPAKAWLCYGLQDVVMHRQRIEVSENPEAQKRVLQQKLSAMLGYCETAQCRRSLLLHYFGETHPPCNHCDTCNHPPAMWDASIAAQKILSAALRTGQRFGAGYLIELLLGKASPRMVQNNHTQLPTFGIGKELTENQWRTIIRQMLAEGFLHASSDYGAIQMTEAARPILKGQRTLNLRRAPEKPFAKKAAKNEAATASAPVDPRFDEALFEKLRQCRKTLAAAQNVPSYIIFHDSTLKALATSRPQTLAALRAVDGVGDQKLARYGAAFLAVLNQTAPP